MWTHVSVVPEAGNRTMFICFSCYQGNPVDSVHSVRIQYLLRVSYTFLADRRADSSLRGTEVVGVKTGAGHCLRKVLRGRLFNWLAC